MPLKNSITDISGILVGHAQDEEALTGCTVILCEGGAVAGVDQRGGAPATRETDVLRPTRLVQEAHAILLTGGSAFGLDAAGGVMRYLEERQVGFNTGVAIVPIVAAASLFDLATGRADIRPDAKMGYQACLNASAEPPPEGNVGAGTGATVGKLLGMAQATKSGLGSVSVEISPGLRVGAIIAVNALGDVIEDGRIIAGLRQGDQFLDTLETLGAMAGGLNFAQGSNTVIGVVATNARFSKEEANKVAQMAQNGLARAIRPAHTMLDGDTIFCLATGERPADASIVGAYAAQVVEEAIVRAVKAAQPIAGLLSAPG